MTPPPYRWWRRRAPPANEGAPYIVQVEAAQVLVAGDISPTGMVTQAVLNQATARGVTMTDTIGLTARPAPSHRVLSLVARQPERQRRQAETAARVRWLRAQLSAAGANPFGPQAALEARYTTLTTQLRAANAKTGTVGTTHRENCDTGGYDPTAPRWRDHVPPRPDEHGPGDAATDAFSPHTDATPVWDPPPYEQVDSQRRQWQRPDMQTAMGMAAAYLVLLLLAAVPAVQWVLR